MFGSSVPNPNPSVSPQPLPRRNFDNKYNERSFRANLTETEYANFKEEMKRLGPLGLRNYLTAEHAGTPSPIQLASDFHMWLGWEGDELVRYFKQIKEIEK